MSRHAPDVVSGYEYREERKSAYRAQRNADDYRNKYLALRKRMREFFREEEITPPPDIEKMIGMKPK